MALTFERRLAALIVLLVAATALAALLTWRNSLQVTQTSDMVAHTFEVMGVLEGALQSLTNVEAVTRGFVITGQDVYLDRSHAARTHVAEEMRRLETLTADNPRQQQRFETLRQLAATALDWNARAIGTAQADGLDAAQQLVRGDQGQATMDAARALVDEMAADEERLLRERQAASLWTTRRALQTLAVLTILICAVALGSHLLVRHQLAARSWAEVALRESEEDLATTLHSMGEAVLATDLAGRIRRLNPAAEQLTGWTEVEAVGRPIADVFRTITEDTHQPAVTLVDSVLAAAESQGRASHTVLVARDGAERPIVNRATPIRDDRDRVSGVVLVFRDVTDEQRAAEALQKSAAAIHDLYDRAPCGYHSLDADGTLVAINQTELDWLGYTRDELIGRKMPDLMTESSRRIFADNFPRFKAQGWIRDLELEVVCKDGRTLPVLVNATAVRDANGRVVYSRTTMVDIRRRKQAEHEVRRLNESLERRVRSRTRQLEATVRDLLESVAAHQRTQAVLRESEERFRLLVEGVRDCAILMLDPDGRVASWNAGAESIKGYRAGEIIGRHFSCFYSAEDVARGAPAENLTVAASAGRYEVEGWRVRKDGSRFWANVLVTALRDEEGRLRGYAKLTRDVTARRQAEEALRQSAQRLRLHVEQTPLAVVEWDLDLRVVRWNRAAERIFGYTAAEAIGRHASFIVPQSARRNVDGMSQMLLAPEGGYRSTTENVHKDGRVLLCAWYHTPLVDADGAVIGMASLADDVTDRTRAEAEIRALNAELERRVQERTHQLEEANRELETFSYSVSHDLRAPLRHVQGYVGMLTRAAGGELSEESRRYLRTIADASREMGVLIDDLLSFSRMGRMELSLGSVNLDGLVRECVGGLETTIRDRRIVWKIPPLPSVTGDRATLKLMVSNLLDNAVKYTRPRDPAEIEVGCGGSEHDQLIFFVRDNGVGFDPAYAHKLFGVFQRLHRADEFEGTGIGLANVRRIVSRHGGRTWADGTPDRGATFYFTLRADRSNRDAGARHA